MKANTANFLALVGNKFIVIPILRQARLINKPFWTCVNFIIFLNNFGMYYVLKNMEIFE